MTDSVVGNTRTATPFDDMAHLTGPHLAYGSVVRQRCAWCGASLVDVDIATIAVHPPPEDPDDPFSWVSCWPVDRWLHRNDGVSTLVRTAGGEVPHNSCMNLLPALPGKVTT